MDCVAFWGDFYGPDSIRAHMLTLQRDEYLHKVFKCSRFGVSDVAHPHSMEHGCPCDRVRVLIHLHIASAPAVAESVRCVPVGLDVHVFIHIIRNADPACECTCSTLVKVREKSRIGAHAQIGTLTKVCTTS